MVITPERLILRGSCRAYYQINSCVEDNVYVLTFDDGPSRSPATARLLKTLMHLGVRASFFLVGQNVRDLPSLVRPRHDCCCAHWQS